MHSLRRVILHRMPRKATIAFLCFTVLCGMAGAQTRRRHKTPRAIALVEWPAKGKPVVVPIAILIDGRYYDASIYMADPVPMALEGGTVYEVEQGGEPLGFATLEGAMNSNGTWTAIAKYQTKASLAVAEKKQSPAVLPDKEEGPPKLHKGGPKPAEQPADKPADKGSDKPQAPSAETKPDTKPDDDGRPKLRKPGEEKPEEAKPAAQPAAAKPPQDSEPDEDLSGRPRLRRGKPVQANVESAPAPTVARTSTTSTAVHGKQAENYGPVRVLPAISDATVTESRPFLIPGSDTASDRMRTGMIDLANAALQKWAAAHGGERIGAVEKPEVRAFDLTLTNQATVVVTALAHLAPAASTATRVAGQRKTVATPMETPTDTDLAFWVTIVARENYNGELRQLQSWTTDSKHLDAYPRMELVDAIDADGDGRGELLFRAVNDLGRSFLISRVTADQVVTLYDSGELRR